MFKIHPKNRPDEATWLINSHTTLSNVGQPDVFFKAPDLPPTELRFSQDAQTLFLDGNFHNTPVKINGRLITHRTAINHLDNLQIHKHHFELFNTNREIQRLSTPKPPANKSKYWRLTLQADQSKHFFLAPYTTIGSNPQSDIYIKHSALSPEHLALSVVGGKVMLKDLSGTERCTVNNVSQSDAILQDSDELRIGPLQFHLSAPASALKEPAAKAGANSAPPPSQKHPPMPALVETSAAEKVWVTKPTSMGNREFDQVDEILHKHKKLKFYALTAMLISLSAVIGVCLIGF